MSQVADTGSMLDGVMDFARAAVLERKGQLFLRRGLRDFPRRLSLVGDGDRLPKNWGGFNRRLYRMFHGTILPTILRNFDRLSMAHGVEVRMPFLDWRLVTYTMALPDESKNREGLTKVIARDAMKGAMPEAIRVQRRKIGFNSPMPTWLNGPLRPWANEVLARRVPAFEALIDEDALRAAVQRLGSARAWTWHSAGRIWPYLHLKWLLGRLDEPKAPAARPVGCEGDLAVNHSIRGAR
jgi:asparagine synthase (glutamine-hydrolysing)